MVLRNFFIIAVTCLLIMSANKLQAAELSPNLHKSTLDNGLTLIVKETPSKKAATVQFWIKAGSVYEAENEGGITHVIEHMIFKGTPTRGPGGIAKAVEELGGQINAYTYYEYTVYHATLSARFWDTALEVLTDAVLNSTFDSAELEREKLVVLEEIRMRNDRPNIKLFQELMTKSYTSHPYRLPIIGTTESVSGFTRDNIIKYISNHYHPENITIVVVGDVKYPLVQEKVVQLLGGIPKGNIAQLQLPQEPAHEKSRFFTIEEDVNQTHLALSFPISPFDSPDTAVLDVMTHILAHGEASRLYNELRNQKGLVYKIDGSAFTPRDPGLLEITATAETNNVIPALEAILAEVFKLKHIPVSDEELARAKRNLESDFVFNLERVEGQARVLGSFEFLAGDPREDDYLAEVRSVSKEEIKEVASKYFSQNGLTAGFLVPLGTSLKIDESTIRDLVQKAEKKAIHSLPPSLVADAYLSNVYRFSLANGITLLVREDPEIPTVAMRAVFPGGLQGETSSTNGAFAFISELLPKGTKDLSARELALKVAEMAGSISGFNGKNTFGIKADFLSRFFEEGLALVRDIILTPAFDTAEAEKIRPELLAQLKQQEDSLPSVAFREFNRLLFKGHPYGLNTAGSETAIKSFTIAELQSIYKEHAKPNRMVLSVAGDVKAEEVQKVVTQLFGDWNIHGRDRGIKEEGFLAPDPPASPEIFNVARNKEQVHIIIGFLGTSLTDPDRYGLEVLDTILSGQSGRLFSELRDKKSLAYSLSSFALLGIDTGSFGIYVGTSPDNRNQTIKNVWHQLSLVQEELISDGELQRAKNVLISHYELGLQTHGSQAMEMALTQTYNLGQDFGKRYVKEISQVSAETVREMARKYIQPNKYVLVTVGGKPNTEEPETAPEGNPTDTSEYE